MTYHRTLEFVQQLDHGIDHWVLAFVGTTRPLNFCIGTLEAVPLPADAFPEVGEVQDTLFVHHGRTPKGALCGAT